MADWLNYNFASVITEPPTGNQLRFDAYGMGATKIWARTQTLDGIDAFYALTLLEIGARIFIQDKNNHLQLVAFRVRASPIDKTDYIEIPVEGLSESGLSLVNGQAVLLVMAAAPTVEPPPDVTPPPGDFSWITISTPLVSLTEAKEHLRLTDTTHDTDVTAKTAAAQEAILAYLTEAGDPAWTAATVPRAVKHAMLLLLTHLYENRGEDMAPDDNVWMAISRLLALYRDPTLA